MSRVFRRNPGILKLQTTHNAWCRFVNQLMLTPNVHIVILCFGLSNKVRSPSNDYCARSACSHPNSRQQAHSFRTKTDDQKKKKTFLFLHTIFFSFFFFKVMIMRRFAKKYAWENVQSPVPCMLSAES